MKRILLSYLRDKHTLWYKLGLMFCCLFFIVLILPDPNKSEFKYEINKPWENEDLIAPFDFAVYKSEGEISSEQNVIRENTPLYYTENDSVFKKNIKLFFSDNQLNKQEEQTCHAAFDTLLQKKIIQLPDSGSLLSPVWILKNKTVSEKHFPDFFTLARADSFLTAYLDKGKSSMWVTEAENALVHTLYFSKVLTKQNLNQELGDMPLIKDKRLKGQSIINKGDVVDESKSSIIGSLKKELEKQDRYNKHTFLALMGKVVYVALCLAMVFLFLGFFRSGIFG
ncbi:MAG TPA: hypothetical protein VNZ49_05405, partial [Bacteroidia bacterium]|nr:hypothetical protein [Bacteroidia bacterium]